MKGVGVVGVVYRFAVQRQHASDPRVVGGLSEGQAEIGNELVGVVIFVHEPGELELPEIVETCNAVRLRLGLSQRGQEHPCENRNDGDDDQEFDESKADVRFRVHFPRMLRSDSCFHKPVLSFTWVLKEKCFEVAELFLASSSTAGLPRLTPGLPGSASQSEN